jgi:hypothetical protein
MASLTSELIPAVEERPPEAPEGWCPQIWVFEGQKSSNLCPEIWVFEELLENLCPKIWVFEGRFLPKLGQIRKNGADYLFATDHT